MALFQIGMQPIGNGWNKLSGTAYEQIKSTKVVPRREGAFPSKKELLIGFIMNVGIF